MKKLFSVFNASTLELFKIESIEQNNKISNLGPKILQLGIFELQFWKAIFTLLKSAFSNLSECKNLCKTKHFEMLDLKCFIWVFFSCNFEKLLPIRILALWNLPECKFLQNKMFWNLWPKSLNRVFLDCKFEKLLSCLKSVLWNLSIFKV